MLNIAINMYIASNILNTYVYKFGSGKENYCELSIAITVSL